VTARKSATKASARKKAARKKTARQKSAARKRLTVSKEKRGLGPEEMLLDPGSPEVAHLCSEVEEAGGVVLGAYREPLSGRPMAAALTRMAASAKKLDTSKVREGEVALVAAASGGSDG
jgi:hypothetical protein